MDNVTSIVEANLCNGCCECLSACASNNISIIFSLKAGHPVPIIADASCAGCGDCIHACRQSALLEMQIV